MLRQTVYKINNKEISVAIGSNLANLLTDFLSKKKHGKLFLLSNETVFPLWGSKIYKVLKDRFGVVGKIIVADGEQYKNFETIESILKQLILEGADRTSILITVGGGVITDMGGFAASIFLRGIPVIHYSTTLLAQVDAAIGGKTGVDFYGFKNMVGSFYQPDAIFCDTETLSTLAAGQMSNGMAEIIKYALIGNDEIYKILKNNNSDSIAKDFIMEDLIRKSMDTKFNIVAADEKESGKRMLLNFGHTFGHAVESASKFSLLHGQAIAIGMVFAYFYSEMRGYTTKIRFEQVNRLIGRYGLKTTVPHSIKINDIFTFMAKDKKRSHGNLRFIFVKNIGVAVEKAYDVKDAIDKFMDMG